MHEESPASMHTLVEDEPTLSLNDTAEVLGCTRRWVYGLLDAHELASSKVGQNRVVTVSSISAHIDRLRQRADELERQARAEGEHRAGGIRSRATAAAERLRAHLDMNESRA
ncbi:helix-turn-helix domain-containing protein [Micromonospora tulbaghiae]|nr:helix-turn-helix domain-containing protein [Micromonospora tulbaghiae]